MDAILVEAVIAVGSASTKIKAVAVQAGDRMSCDHGEYVLKLMVAVNA